jgi:hypothetical protein
MAKASFAYNRYEGLPQYQQGFAREKARFGQSWLVGGPPQSASIRSDNKVPAIHEEKLR